MVFKVTKLDEMVEGQELHGLCPKSVLLVD